MPVFARGATAEETKSTDAIQAFKIADEAGKKVAKQYGGVAEAEYNMALNDIRKRNAVNELIVLVRDHGLERETQSIERLAKLDTIFKNTRKQEADVVRPHDTKLADGIMNTRNFDELKALNQKYESLFKQYGIWDQIQKIQAEGVKQYNETKSKLEIGTKEQQQATRGREYTKNLAGFVGSAEEKGAEEGKKKLDEGKAAKTKTDFFTS